MNFTKFTNFENNIFSSILVIVDNVEQLAYTLPGKSPSRKPSSLVPWHHPPKGSIISLINSPPFNDNSLSFANYSK